MTSSSVNSDDMRAPLSLCRKNLALARRGDGDRCLKGSVVACGTVVLIPSGLVSNPVRGRGDEGEISMTDGDASKNCGWSGAKSGILLLLDILAGLEG